MDTPVKPSRKKVPDDGQSVARPARTEAEDAVRTLIRWAGDDPSRDGLEETPARVARAFEEYFKGYQEDPEALLEKTFEEIEGYDEMIVLRGIRFEEAMEQLARYLDRAYAAGMAEVTIIHGLGTGALKTGTVELLRKLGYVKHFQDGGIQRGGLGATIVQFDRD